MLSITVIIFFSVVLFVYWFRYSCLLILQDRSTSPALQTAGARLNFPAVQQRLKDGERAAGSLDQLQQDLGKDYRMLSFVLRCSPDTGIDPIERRMLALDYRIMQAWYGVTRRVAPPQAREALEEMSSIVSYFAYSAGRNAVQSSNA